MLELCIDTSAGISVAVVEDGKVVSRQSEVDGRRHAEDLSALIEKAAKEAQLQVPLARAGWDRVLVGTGPAPYTGLRAGLITAQIFARAASIPVYGVPSLSLIARAALDVLPENTDVIAVTDAKRKEVYWARYRARGPNDIEALTELQVGPPDSVAVELRRADATLVGPGAPIVWERVRASTGPIERADAAVLSRLVRGSLMRGEELPVEPLYLRRPDTN